MDTKQNATVEQYAEYYRLVRHVSDSLFGKGKLPDLMLQFANARSKATMACVVYNAWEKDGVKINSLCLSPRIFSLPFRDIVSHVARQLVNHWQFTAGFPTLPQGRAIQGSAMTYTNQENADQMKRIGLKPIKKGKDGKNVETGQGVSFTIAKGQAFDEMFKVMPSDIAFPWSALPESVKVKEDNGKKKATRAKYTGRIKSGEVNAWAAPGMALFTKEGNKYVQLLEVAKQAEKAA